ncbi:uncharacterized protein K489DRAFT_376647 [Dissoconium aciculare CBS 342.82]|uniref:Uncharacterized protein n=1 Tax=Dissoconium aciculare CBS 342.82 TaxID=1314786 RepID=A0A6J3ME08_9PEZI|nr:uncharacterized protein K489DRAFT_376647 [Dissoconium aciculare CBS 342.82]KAF1826251.1 hypothetical protein K489DRAFT_376647 [Dissoconium aciculare CBS 342.82]
MTVNNCRSSKLSARMETSDGSSTLGSSSSAASSTTIDRPRPAAGRKMHSFVPEHIHEILAWFGDNAQPWWMEGDKCQMHIRRPNICRVLICRAQNKGLVILMMILMIAQLFA